MRYFAVLGLHPALSLAELRALLDKEDASAAIVSSSYEAAIFESSKKVDSKSLQERSGGIVKLGIIRTLFTWDEVLSEDVAHTILQVLKEKKGSARVSFGFSLYTADQRINERNFEKLASHLKRIGLVVKKFLKEEGVASRFVTSRDRYELSSVVVKKNHLIQEGAELVFLVGGSQVFLGKTASVQSFEDWSKRDFGRPARDPKSGMLPPKLARIMINLAKAPRGGILLDPFCGSGTVLMEASLLGYKVVGADADAQAIERTRKNLSWLEVPHPPLFQTPVEQISNYVKPASIDAIATEPSLGPSLKASQSEKILTRSAKDLARLYSNAFKEFKKILKKDGVVVFVMPVFFHGKKTIYVPALESILALGFHQKRFESERGALRYMREDQRLGREIFVFEI